jgi:hypothetical protein
MDGSTPLVTKVPDDLLLEHRPLAKGRHPRQADVGNLDVPGVASG